MHSKYTITRLPELTPENLEPIMEERLRVTKNSKTVIPMLWQGLLELVIPVNGQERTAKYYIPKDTPQGTAIVILNVPDSEETLPFLEKSGWIERADLEEFCLFVLEPGPGGWGTPEDEHSYLLSGFQAVIQGQYLLAAFAAYVVGYGVIGVGLHKAVMADPLHVAAAVFLDAGDVEDEYRKEYETKCYDIPDAFDPNGEGLRVPYREIPVPVRIASGTIRDQCGAMIDYWKKAAKTSECFEDSVFGTVYLQSAPTIYTPEGNILKVAVQECSYNYCDKETTAQVYAFLKQYYRYGMGPCSNMISKRADFNAMGVEHRLFTDVNGIAREYLVYIPAAYRYRKKSLPAVIAYHGASQSMRNMMSNGLWYEIADREGIIIVYPESTLRPMPPALSGKKTFAYRPLWSLEDGDDHSLELEYANELLDRIIAEFPVDEERIYCTGHSMGCMMTNYLGSSPVSHRFAAVAATSGFLRAYDGRGVQPVPAFMTMGQFDLWPYLVSEESPVTAAIDMWLVRNGLATKENVREVRTFGVSEICKENNYNHYRWKDAAGVTWVDYAWISQKHHVHTAGECLIFWEQWFSHWSLKEDGRRQYEKNRRFDILI